jgi:hypothetical protein
MLGRRLEPLDEDEPIDVDEQAFGESRRIDLDQDRATFADPAPARVADAAAVRSMVGLVPPATVLAASPIAASPFYHHLGVGLLREVVAKRIVDLAGQLARDETVEDGSLLGVHRCIDHIRTTGDAFQPNAGTIWYVRARG